MTVRRLSAADWKIFRDIRLEMLSQSPGAFGSTFTDWVTRPEAEIRTWLDRIYTLGRFERRTLVATAAMVRATGGPSRHRAEVVAVYAKPEARGQGIAAGLLRQLATDARAVGVLQLELQVMEANAPAVALYERLGFRTVGRIPRAVRHDDKFHDDLMMVWPIDTD